MALDPLYMVDNSAMNRYKHAAVAARLEPLIRGGVVATCGALDIEALYSAQSPAEYERMRAMRGAAFTYVETDEDDWQQALSVQRELAAKSQHRGPKVPDLVIAAVAQRHGLTLLHYDSDFDRIVEFTGQKGEWVVPRGSVP
ncbi:PIN domain nuclease [Streptomyces sp. NPDC048420]|uniref:PIN domain nuclease n=1 Tax=Streptomyces sp. NPDC048420 TaxID=3155755 RepID=UPI003446C8D4